MIYILTELPSLPHHESVLLSQLLSETISGKSVRFSLLPAPTSGLYTDKKRTKPSNILLAHVETLKEKLSHLTPSDLLITLGTLPFQAVCGFDKSLLKWRGSQLTEGSGYALLPTYSPYQINRQWPLRQIAKMDLTRAARYADWEVPAYDFITRPTAPTVIKTLTGFLSLATTAQLTAQSDLHLSLDIETRRGHISCIGLGSSPRSAICIPFWDVRAPDSHYWSESEEIEVTYLLLKVFNHPHISCSLQNGLYDFQYLIRFYGSAPRLRTDTMLEHHVLWAGDIPKGLDFLSSMYCSYHRYWKDEGKNWDPRTHDEDQHWIYNCKDCVTTWEIAEALPTCTQAYNLTGPRDFQIKENFPAVLSLMLRGVRCNEKRKGELSLELLEVYTDLQSQLHALVGEPLNVRSPKQMAEFFYGTLGAVVKTQKTRRYPWSVTCNNDALTSIKKKQPWLSSIIDLILLMRSVGVFRSTFIEMALDKDHRLRCSYNIAGTETYRYSSSENAFGSGGNLQNIPGAKGGSILPNVKDLFLPDPGYVIIDADLDRADAQVVAWEANDEILKQMFREGADIHLENAKAIFNNERLTADSKERKLAKGGVHAANYGVSARTLAISLGITTREAEAFLRKWFHAHPGILEWHRETENSLATSRCVVNRFGFRRYYFDRVEGLLPEALAWIPQSTVAIVVDKGLVRIHRDLPRVESLLQVHDSIVMQVRGQHLREQLPLIKTAMSVLIPYPDPLIIPVSAQASSKSLGAVKDIPWNIHPNYTT